MPTAPWLALVLTASAGSSDAVFERLLTSIDLDGSGTVDAAEYAQVDEVGQLATLDSDGDGALSAAELGQWIRVTQPRPDARRAHRASVDKVLRPGPKVTPAGQAAATATGSPQADPRRNGRLAALATTILAGGLLGGVLLGLRSRRRR